jgi:hypothetical protein
MTTVFTVREKTVVHDKLNGKHPDMCSAAAGSRGSSADVIDGHSKRHSTDGATLVKIEHKEDTCIYDRALRFQVQKGRAVCGTFSGLSDTLQMHCLTLYKIYSAFNCLHLQHRCSSYRGRIMSGTSIGNAFKLPECVDDGKGKNMEITLEID